MQTTFHLNADELTVEFVESIKTLFGTKPIEIIVKDTSTVTTDTDDWNESTAYLFGDAARRERLLRRMDEVERGEGLITVPLETIENLL
jgi:hypothetical protein